MLKYVSDCQAVQTMAHDKLRARISTIAGTLNERQRAYLTVAYDIDQRAERLNAGPGGRKACEWRWLDYGPDGRLRRFTYDGLLRVALEEMKLIDKGAGSTWHSLEERRLLITERRPIAEGDLESLFIQLTPDGRRVARVLKGLPLIKPKPDLANKPMSITALRILRFAQQQPTEFIDPFEPWLGRSYYPDPMIALGTARGLAKRGLLQADQRGTSFRITPAGEAIAVEEAENWKPFSAPAMGEPGWMEHIMIRDGLK